LPLRVPAGSLAGAAATPGGAPGLTGPARLASRRLVLLLPALLDVLLGEDLAEVGDALVGVLAFACDLGLGCLQGGGDAGELAVQVEDLGAYGLDALLSFQLGGQRLGPLCGFGPARSVSVIRVATAASSPARRSCSVAAAAAARSTSARWASSCAVRWSTC